MKLSATKLIAKNFSWLIAGEVVSKIFMLFMVAYIARVLGVAAFGKLNFAQAVAAYLYISVDFGISMYGIREIARKRDLAGPLSLNLLVIRSFLALITFGISLPLLLLLPIPQELRLLLIGTFLLVFYKALDPEWVFRALEKMEYVGISRMVLWGISLLLVLFFVKSAGDLVKIPFLLFASGIAVVFFFIFVLYKYFISFRLQYLSFAKWRTYLAGAFPLGVTAVFTMIYFNIDTIMLGLMKTAQAVGLYNAAYKAVYAIILLLGLWLKTVFPLVSKRFAENREWAIHFLQKFLRLTFMLVFLAAFVVTLLAPLIIYLVFGSHYLPSTIALQILIWSIIPIAVSGTYGMLISISLGHAKDVLFGAIAGAVINIVLNLVLIPSFGFLGASVATLITETVVALIVFTLAYKRIPFGFLGYIVKPFMASIISLPVALIILYYLLPLNTYSAYAVSAGVFSFLYIVFLYVLGEGPFLKEFAREIYSQRQHND